MEFLKTFINLYVFSCLGALLYNFLNVFYTFFILNLTDFANLHRLCTIFFSFLYGYLIMRSSNYSFFFLLIIFFIFILYGIDFGLVIVFIVCGLFWNFI